MESLIPANQQHNDVKESITALINEFNKGWDIGHRVFYITAEDTGCYGLDIGTTSSALLKAIFEAGEGRVGRRFHIGLERNHARQLHLETGAVHRAVVIGDDVHAFEEHRLDRVLPRPQRERVIAQRSEIRVEHQSGETAGRNVHVQATLLDLLGVLPPRS